MTLGQLKKDKGKLISTAFKKLYSIQMCETKRQRKKRNSEMADRDITSFVFSNAT